MEKITNKDLVYFADFETTTENTQYYKANRDTTITLWVLRHINDKEHKIGINLDTFMDEIEQLPNGAVVMFHNLAFDVRFIWTHLLTRNWKMVSGSFWDTISKENPLSNVAKTKAYYPESNQFAIGGDGSKVYFMTLYYPATKKKIDFRCSLKLLPLSIAKIGKSIGMDKHNDETLVDGFYDVEPQSCIYNYPKAYIEYAKRDVDIICEFYKIFLKFINTIQDDLKINPELRIKGIPTTIGALSITLQERYLKSRETFGKETRDKNGKPTWKKFDTALKITGQQNDLARKFYLGGLTLFNANGLKQEWCGGAYVDINSSYPNSMTLPLPYGFATKNKPNGVNGETYLTYYHIYVKKAKIKNKLGLYPLQDWLSKLGQKPKYSYLKNNIELLYYFDCFYLDKEWELMKQFYDFEYEIKETYYLFAKPYLKDYTETLYKYKENATDKNYREFYKLLLNNGYGKYGQDRNYDVIYPVVNDTDYDIRINQELLKYKNQDKHTKFYFNRLYVPKKILSGSYYDRDNLKVIKYKRVNTDAYGNPNVWVAATITAYSRINLLQSVLKCGNDKGIVKYTDTDSMMLSESSYTQYLDLDDSKLGKWKVEHNNCKFTITGKKMYKLEYQDENGKWQEMYKAKGVSKQNQKELIDKMIRDGDDDIYLAGGKRCKMQTYSGWIITDMDVVINNNPLAAGYVGVKDEKDTK